MSPRGQSLRQGPRGVQSEWLATPFSEIVLTRTISENSFAKYPVSDPSQRLSSRGQSLRDPSSPGGSLQRTRLVPPKTLVLRSWYQDLGTKILVPRSWYQDFGTKILGPRSWLLATYLIPGCVGRGARLGSESSSGAGAASGGVWKSGNLESKTFPKIRLSE